MLHAPAPGGLHLCDIRGSAGEIGLRASAGEDYFGLIYIGDTSAFKKLVEEDAAGITLEEDALAGSLFEGINRPETRIELLIGAKKFMEGWNSWRVASMGLLNIGRQEGSQIIQLFGRGVRLRGKGFSLKRSTSQDPDAPRHIGLLETLNIFAVRANYMGQFRAYLEKEGVESDEPIELPLFVWANQEFLRQGLVAPRLPDDSHFAAEALLVLAPDPAVQVRVDLIVTEETQRIVFIEPHGMSHANAYEHDEKARLREALPALAQDIAARSARQHVTLDHGAGNRLRKRRNIFVAAYPVKHRVASASLPPKRRTLG